MLYECSATIMLQKLLNILQTDKRFFGLFLSMEAKFLFLTVKRIFKSGKPSSLTIATQKLQAHNVV